MPNGINNKTIVLVNVDDVLNILIIYDIPSFKAFDVAVESTNDLFRLFNIYHPTKNATPNPNNGLIILNGLNDGL